MFQRLLLSYLRHFPIDFGKQKLVKFAKLPEFEKVVGYTNSDGFKFSLDLKEYQMKQIYLFDRYEKNSIRHLGKVIQKIPSSPKILFDVGANIGFYSMYLSFFTKNTAATIHAFEPNPITYQKLVDNMSNNQIKNITLNKFGLSNAAAEIEISFNYKNLGAASVFNNKGENKTIFELQTLDEYCEKNSIQKIDLIKVDIEGSELNFLKGGEKVISASTNLIVIMEIVDENCRAAGYSSEELFRYMTERNFRAYIPKPWPRKLKQVKVCPDKFHDNIFFVRGNFQV